MYGSVRGALSDERPYRVSYPKIELLPNRKSGVLVAST